MEASDVLPVVIAGINYVEDTDQVPQFSNVDERLNKLPLINCSVKIEDASRSGREATLDREGFTLVTHASSVADPAADDAPLDIYRSELKRLLLELTGADDVRIEKFSPVRRVKPRADIDFHNCLPAGFAHSDCTAAGVDAMVEWAYGADRPDRPIRRMALYNLWRLLSPAPADMPLAVLDWRTLEEADVIPGYSHFNDFSLQSAFVRYNPQHRWVYYSRMRSDQILIFKQFDTATRQPCLVPHCAFAESGSARELVPRVSIEARAMASWFEV